MGKKSSPSGKKKTPDRVGKSVQQTDSTGDEVDGEVSEVKFLKFLEECMNDDVKTQRAVSSVRELVNIHQPILHVTLPKRIVSNNNADRIEWLLRASEIIFEQVNTIPWAFSVKSTEKADVQQVKARLAHAVQQQQQQQQQQKVSLQQQSLQGRLSTGEQSAGQLNQSLQGRLSTGEQSAGQLNQQSLQGRLSTGEQSAGQLNQTLQGRLSTGEQSAGQLNQSLQGRLSTGEQSAGQLNQQSLQGRLSTGEQSAGQLNQTLQGRLSTGEQSAGQLNQSLQGRLSTGEQSAGQLNQQSLQGRLSTGEQSAGQLYGSQVNNPSQNNEFICDKPVRQPSQMGGISQRANEFICDKPVRHPAQRGGVSQRANEFNCDKPGRQPSQRGRLSQSDDEFIWDEPFGQLLQRSTALMRELNPEGRQQQQRRQVQPSQMGGVSQRANEFICDKPVRQPSQMGGLSQSDQLFNCDRPVSQPSQMGGLSQNDNVFICDSPVRQPSQRGGLSQRANEVSCDNPVRQPSQMGGLSQRANEVSGDNPVRQPSQMGGLSQRANEVNCDNPVRQPSQMGGVSQSDKLFICDRPVSQPSQMSHVARNEQKYEEAQQQHQHQFIGAEHTEEEGAGAARYTRVTSNASDRGATSRQHIREECREYQRQQEGYQAEAWNRPGRTQERHAPAYEYPDGGDNKYDDHQVKWAEGTSRGGGDDGERTKHQGIHRGYERVRLCGGTEVRGGADKLEETDNRFGWQETMGKMMDVWQKANEKQTEVWQRSSEKQVLATVRHDQFSGEDKAEFKYWFEDLLGRMEETCLTDDEKLRHLVGCLKGNAKRQFREDNVRPTWKAALQYLSEKYGNRYEKRSKEADRFHTRMQKSGESIREYAFALKRLCPIDEMNSYYEEYMTGQLIIGLQSARDREKATYEFEIKRASFANIVKGIEDYEYCRDKVSSRGSQAVKPSQRGAGTEQWERGREQTRGGAVKYEHTQQQSANQRQTYQPPANSSMRQAPYQVNTQQPPPGHSWNRQQNSNQQQRVNQVQWSGLRQPVQDYQQKQRLSGGRECFKCGEVGHLQSSCSNEDQGQMAGERPPQSFGHQTVRAVSVAKPVEDVEAVSAEVRALKDELAQLKHRDEFRYGMLSAKVHKMLMNDGIEKENESEKKEATVRAVSVSIQSFNAEAQKKDYYPIEVNGQPVGLKQVLFDTGAQMNLISQNFAAQLGVKIQPCKTPLVAVNMTTVVCAGVCTVELKIDGKLTVMECHVATESNTPLLVGTKAMQEQGIQLLSWTGRSLMASVIPAEGDVLNVRVPLVVAEKPEDKNGVISVSTEHDEEVKPATENVVESSETSNGELATGQDMNKWFSVPSEQYSQLKLMLPELLQQPAGELSRVTVSDPVIKLVQNRMEHGQMKLKPEFQRDVKGIIVKTGHCLGQIHSRMKAAVSKCLWCRENWCRSCSSGGMW